MTFVPVIPESYTHVLAEFESLDPLLSALRLDSSRLKCSSIAVSRKWLALGSSGGGLNLIQKEGWKHRLFLSHREGAISQVACCSHDDDYVAVATSQGFVVVWELNQERRGKPERIYVSSEHKGRKVTALCWDTAILRVFVGDHMGKVSAIKLNTSKQARAAVTFVMFPVQTITTVDSCVVQLDYLDGRLLISSLTRSFLCDTEREKFWKIGNKERDGEYGACFFPGRCAAGQQPLIYCARPGSRMWEVNFDGEVISTHQFKKLLSSPPLPVITLRSEPQYDHTVGSSQSLSFPKLLHLSEHCVLTWTERGIYIFVPQNVQVLLWSEVKGMPKEKYEPPDPRKMYTIMSTEEAANGKKSHWAELEISGRVRSLSSSLWSLTHLTALHLSDNFLSRIPSDIAKLHNLVYLDLSSNKIRSLPAELGNMVSLRELHLNNNLLRVLPFEMGKLFQLQTLGLKGNPLTLDILNLYQEPDGTKRLLNYLLDNLAGTAKRISTEQPPPRSWIMLQEPDRTRPTANTAGKPHLGTEKQLILVANAHMHWDPEYSDVKLVQTMMFLSEVKNIIDEASRSLHSSALGELGNIPLVLCADLNSLPDSGVVEYLSTGGVETNHKDFKELRYNESLTNFSCNGKNGTTNGRITHGFKLKSAYESGLMPYTNYTFDFKGIIDYIFYSKPQLNTLGILGPLDHHWLVENNISGCPHPLIPSDHFSLFAQLELLLPFLPQVNGIHLPGRR